MKFFYFLCISLQALMEEKKKKIEFEGERLWFLPTHFVSRLFLGLAFVFFFTFFGRKIYKNVYFKYQIITAFERNTILDPPYILTKIL